MLIDEVISRVDALYPNLYTRAEKLAWCYELTALIYAEYKKLYSTLVLMKGEGEPLPPEILSEDIVEVRAKGRRYFKTDNRSFLDIAFPEGEIEVVYRFRPPVYAEEEYSGTYTLGNETKDGKERGALTALGALFRVRDVIEIDIGGEKEHREVVEVSGDTYYFYEPFLRTGEIAASLKKVLKEETPMPAPYDSMYIHYLLGKIAFYQNDLQEYNKHMIEFNNELDSYAKWYKQTNPLVHGVRFKNLW